MERNSMEPKNLIIAGISHLVETEEYGKGDSVYRISFRVDDAFMEINSHAGEISLLCVYAPDGECASEGDAPYIAIQCDDEVCEAVQQFKKTRRIDAASEVTPLSGKFLFRAKMPYYEETEDLLMYFYGLDRCDGFWDDQGLCLVYPQSLAGTEQEKQLMQILDAAAESYTEELLTKEVREDVPKDTAAEKSSGSEKTVNDILKKMQTAKQIRFWVRVTIIVGTLLAVLASKVGSYFSMHHLVQRSGNETIISEFTDAQQAAVLDAFEVTIPENEPDAELVTLMRSDRYGTMVSYVIEIGGVSDYEAFYEANASRKLGQSVNEIAAPANQRKYYLTYNVSFINDPAHRSKDANAAAYNRIEAVFDQMQQ